MSKEYDLKQIEVEVNNNNNNIITSAWRKEAVGFIEKEVDFEKVELINMIMKLGEKIEEKEAELKERKIKKIFERENIFQFYEIIEMLKKIEQEIKNLASKENVINYFKKIEISKEEKKTNT